MTFLRPKRPAAEEWPLEACESHALSAARSTELRRSLDPASVLRRLGAHVDETASLGMGPTILGRGSDPARLTIESGAEVGAGCSFDLSGEVRIGKGAKVGSQVVFLTEGSAIVLGEGSTVGARTLVGPGTCVGDGAVVAAASVVLAAVAPGARVAGNPATELARRQPRGADPG